MLLGGISMASLTAAISAFFIITNNGTFQVSKNFNRDFVYDYSHLMLN